MNFNKNKTKKKLKDLKFLNNNQIKSFSIKKLKFNKKKSLGKSSNGTILVRHRGGGSKRNYRILNTFNKNAELKALIISFEYDPNRTSHIALIQFENGSFSYIPATAGMQVGDIIQSNKSLKKLNKGSTLSLKNIPLGINICNIEKYSGSGPIYCRSAGNFSKILKKDSKNALIVLPSGEKRYIPLDSTATLGKVSNSFSNINQTYKAGTSRLLGKRPHVRGVAMNPIDHPHGGGEGKTSGGRPSVSPWGKLTKGVPTSRNRRIKNPFIVKS